MMIVLPLLIHCPSRGFSKVVIKLPNIIIRRMGALFGARKVTNLDGMFRMLEY